MYAALDSFTTYSTTSLPFTRVPRSAEKTVTPLEESIYMLETGMNEQMRRGELRAKRNLLFERFSKNPSEIHLAIEIKSIDDQVAESLFIATDKEPCQRKQSLPPRTITGTPMEQIQKSSHAKLPFAISPG